MGRIYSIDFFKLLFAYIIAYSHLSIYLPGMNSSVVFFFMISGYFLAKKYYGKKRAGEVDSYSGARYTLDHVKSLYPHYILSLAIMFAYFCIRNVYYIFIGNPQAISLPEMLKKLYYTLPEIFMVQNIGFYDGGMNYPLWQVCTLLICGYFIYALLCHNEKLSVNIIFPLSIILIQVFLTKNSVDPFGTVSMVYIPLIRAFCAISYGVLIYRLLQSEFCINVINKHKTFINVCSILALITIFVYSDYNILYITAVFVFAGLTDRSSWLNAVLNRKLFRNFGEFSYSVYLNHALVIWIINDFKQEIFAILHTSETQLKISIIFFILLTLYSIATMYITKAFKKKIKPA